jgi:prepilin-type N-terminal cleavage/methylation domain-containing protein
VKTTSPSPAARRRGVTLIELSLVILVMLALAGLGLYFANGHQEWQRGKDAAEKLRSVYAAQKNYLADNPTVPVGSLTTTRIVPYLPSGETSIPTVQAADGTTRTIRLNVSPPVVDNGSGGTYDPSGSSSDGLWDVGW